MSERLQLFRSFENTSILRDQDTSLLIDVPDNIHIFGLAAKVMNLRHVVDIFTKSIQASSQIKGQIFIYIEWWRITFVQW